MKMDPTETIEESDSMHRGKRMQVEELNYPDYPIGIDDIETVIQSGFYADKTHYIWKLIKNGSPTFLIRPRRFGKTLFIKTIAKIAEGESSKDLFKGCFIGYGKRKYQGKEVAYDWKKISRDKVKLC